MSDVTRPLHPSSAIIGVTTGVTIGVRGVTTGVTTGVSEVTTGIRGVTTGVSAVTTGVTTGVSGVTTVVATGIRGVTTGVSGVTTGVSRVSTGVTTGVTSGVGAFDRVLISVDEAEGVLHLDGSPFYSEPLRALSLNRLDTMDDSIPSAFMTSRQTEEDDYRHQRRLYRCPSLPGMDRHLSTSARTVSTTNLETDLESLSPRVSTTTLSQDLDRDRFGLSLCSMPFLARSTSARTIEGLPPADQNRPPPVATHKTANDLLVTPHVTVHVTVRRRKSCVRAVYRSASCPSLTEFAGRWGHASSVYRRRPVLRSQSPRADINLEGEEIKDLPIEPRKNFPEFSPDLLEGITGKAGPSCSTAHRPSFPIPGEPDGLLPVSSGVPTPRLETTNSRHLPGSKNYFNVGDVPSSFARPIFVDERFAKQRAPRLVQIKCLQWLNSLDSNR